MTIQLTTESLIKSRHFVWQSWKVLFQNKKAFLILSVIPISLQLLIGISSLIFNKEPNFIFDIISVLFGLIGSALFLIAWLRFLLDPSFAPSLKSALCFDKKFLKTFLYSLLSVLLLVLCIGIPVALGFWTAYGLAFTNGAMITGILVTFVSILGLFYYICPLALIFPNIALDKPAGIFKIFKETASFRGRFMASQVWSLLSIIFFIAGLVACIFLIGLLFYGILFLLNLGGLETFAISSTIRIGVGIIIGTFGGLLIMLMTQTVSTLSLNITALYYKKHLMN